MDFAETLKDELVQLAGLAVAGDPDKARVHVMRRARDLLKVDPALSHALRHVASATGTAPRPSMNVDPSPMRRLTSSRLDQRPEDRDSQLELLKVEPPSADAPDPVYEPWIRATLDGLVKEHRNSRVLERAGLYPTRSLLLAGPPGVGKTLAARWLAVQLNRPLYVLDLGSVMSRFLGATGVNVKKAFAFARSNEAILLLDELDSVAKRRDDATDVGELKRLVTVIIQELDDWPEGHLVIGATNHLQLLDPAIFRRFEQRLDLPAPSEAVLSTLLSKMCDRGSRIPPLWKSTLPKLLVGTSHSELLRAVMRMRRAIAINPSLTDEDALAPVVQDFASGMDASTRRQTAISLSNGSALSDRFLAATFNVSRDTLRRARTSG